ncbi:MAG: hypothetical protein A3C53_07635 [Omnitrophica WOR_2 bacterium RIFCSPHIGHO2_02_FULL_68_15]|nr:MAG: hypothetical protein A3C53_07635 [Omnitrophica WOR_2 bacterium RIFCSPHIGHO2_02_FULL_68_15]
MRESVPRAPIRLLLIEDSAGDARLIQEALKSDEALTFQVVWTQRLAFGLERLAHDSFDVILLDLSLPDSHGIATLLTVHAKAASIPIIVLTGLGDEQFALEAVQKGAQDYLEKASVQVDSRFLTRAIRYAIERKRAEHERLRLASFTEQNPHPIVETTLGGVVTYLNAAAREQFPDLDATEDHPILESMRAAAIHLQQTGGRSMTQEVVCGEQIFEQYISHVRELQAIQSYTVDITERKRAERMKDEFLSTVSHELRTPLAIMKEFIAILADQIAGPLTSGQQEYLGIVQSNINRLARIVNDLLDMAKIEAGRVVLDKGLVDVAAMLDGVAQSMRPLVEPKQIALEVQLPPTVPVLFADADKITQILLNLVHNAIKFTPGPGRVTLSVAERPDEIEFSVSDTGVGIAADDLPKLFEKFQQVNPVVSETGSKGTGLGLAISKRFVELHGGRLGVTSAPGQGSTFSFTLPTHHPEELFHEYFKAGIERAKREQGRFSIVVISVQDFQELKARFSVEETGRLLKELEATLQETVRSRQGGDVVVRWRRGAVVIVLAATDQAGARAMIGRITHAVGSRPFTVGSQAVTIPIVVTTATYPDEGKTEQELLRLAESRLAPSAKPKSRILVVDDEPKIRQFIKEVLELQDYEVTTAASGPDALQQLQRLRVDLILMDLMMPVMDGYEVSHLLREHPVTKDVPVIIVTAKGERKDRQLGLEGPTYNYLMKPFQIEELLAKVREVLHQSVVS